MAAGEVKCVYFRATDGKHAGDLGRNIEEIEAVIDDVQGVSMHEDPHDNTTFLLTIPGNVDDSKIDGIVTRLCLLTDKKNGKTLLEAWPSSISLQNLSHGFTSEPHFISEKS